MLVKSKRTFFRCYKCEAIVKIPEDFQGNSYSILNQHYIDHHQIDLDGKTSNLNCECERCRID